MIPVLRSMNVSGANSVSGLQHQIMPFSGNSSLILSPRSHSSDRAKEVIPALTIDTSYPKTPQTNEKHYLGNSINSMSFTTQAERKALRQAKASHSRQTKREQQVKTLIQENQTTQERNLARRAIMQAENEMAIEEARIKTSQRLDRASLQIQTMFDHKKQEIATRSIEQEKRIVASHARKLEQERMEKDYYETLVDKKREKLINARKKVIQENMVRAQERVEIANARTQRHQENLEQIIARGKAENIILQEKVYEKVDRSNLFRAYREALAEDSKAYAAKARAEREVIRAEARTFDQMDEGAKNTVWTVAGAGRGRVNFAEERALR